MNIKIHQGNLICKATACNHKADLYISDGKIINIGSKPDGFVVDSEINAHNKIVCPGFIDLYARIGEPGFEYKSTIASETYAAAAGGITTVCQLPDTDPINDHVTVSTFIQQQSKLAARAQILPLGALTKKLAGEELCDYATLKAAGCVAFSQAERPIYNTQILKHCYEYAATHNLLVFINAQDPWFNTKGGVHEGEISTRLGLPAIPAYAEQIDIARHLALIQATGVRAHFNKLSSGKAVEQIAQAQAQGLAVTADVSIMHLFFNTMDVAEFDSNFHLQPPLRSETDQFALIDALRTGTISAIVSDHFAHEREAKRVPFIQSAPGMASFEVLLAFALRLQDKNMQLEDIIAKLTLEPAKILGLAPHLGTLAIGATANICIFDAQTPWQLTPENWHSRGENTAFWNWPLVGQVSHTLVNGKVVFQK